MSGKVIASSVESTVETSIVSSAIMSIVTDTTISKSAKIRTLHSNGLDRSTIANLLNIRYQHVRNVLLTPLATK